MPSAALFAVLFALCVSPSLAHMRLNSPPPFGAENNPHRTDPADERLTFPYNCCGRKTEFPCGGYLKLLGTPQGQPTASWEAGSQQTWNMTGIGNHYGGSCQVGFSVDKGKTFQVAKSYEGNCPLRKGGNLPAGQNFDFVVPADVPSGDVVFAWTWFNREAEFYMNCAAVTITGGSGSGAGTTADAGAATPNGTVPMISPTAAKPSSYETNGCTCTCPKPDPPARAMLKYKRAGAVPIAKRAAPAVPYSKRPGMLFADLDNGCTTPKSSAEVKYPNPGPDVQTGDGEYPLALPTPPEKCGY